MKDVNELQGSIKFKAYQEVLMKTHDFLDSFREGRMDLAMGELNYLLEMTRIISLEPGKWREEIAKVVEENKSKSSWATSSPEDNINKQRVNGATDLGVCIANTIKNPL